VAMESQIMSLEEIILKDARVHMRAVYGGKDGHDNVIRRLLELRNDIDVYLRCLEEFKQKEQANDKAKAL